MLPGNVALLLTDHSKPKRTLPTHPFKSPLVENFYLLFYKLKLVLSRGVTVSIRVSPSIYTLCTCTEIFFQLENK